MVLVMTAEPALSLHTFPRSFCVKQEEGGSSVGHGGKYKHYHVHVASIALDNFGLFLRT